MLDDLSFFLAHPKLNDICKSLSFKKSILLIIMMIVLYFGFAILTSILFLPILKFLNLFPEKGIRLSQMPLSFRLIFFVPIFEEMTFRLPLIFSKHYLFLSLAALQFTLFYHVYGLIVLSIISIIIALIPYSRLIPEASYFQLGLICR